MKSVSYSDCVTFVQDGMVIPSASLSFNLFIAELNSSKLRTFPDFSSYISLFSCAMLSPDVFVNHLYVSPDRPLPFQYH
jgi:hypothetical protein